MISKKFIYDELVPMLEEKSRRIDILLIQSLFENKDKELVFELRKYQNKDGGFGNGLEPDVRMPNSSVLATTMAVKILHEVRDKDLKLPLIKDIVEYYESQYDKNRKGFNMVSKEVNEHPRAIWWNFEDLEKNFPFGNPDPEVIGFLYKYRKYLKKLNVSALINEVVSFVMSDEFMESGFHTLISTLYFYKRVDADVRNLIHDRLHTLAKKEIDASIGKWDEYALEPYKIYAIEPHFVNTHLEVLGKNLQQNLLKVKNLEVTPSWQWYQYDDVFEEVKHDWVGHLYFDMLKAFRRHKII